MVVLDTNVIIDFLDGKEKVVSAVSGYIASELSMTFVNEYELLKYHRRGKLEEALENLRVYHSSEAAIKASVNAYRHLKSKGTMISDSDLLIFGVCAANNETLLTQDRAFESLHNESIIVIR
jgi:predicted nucleic acid-binding protein